jgi:hypothetical protein
MNVQFTIKFTYSKTLWEDSQQVQHALHALGFRTPEAKFVKEEEVKITGYSAIIAGNIEATKESIKELIQRKYFNSRDISITHELL